MTQTFHSPSSLSPKKKVLQLFSGRSACGLFTGMQKMLVVINYKDNLIYLECSTILITGDIWMEIQKTIISVKVKLFLKLFAKISAIFIFKYSLSFLDLTFLIFSCLFILYSKKSIHRTQVPLRCLAVWNCSATVVWANAEIHVNKGKYLILVQNI